MQAHTLPAQRGWAWIIEGFRLWKRNPALLTFLVFGYWLCLLVVAAIPFVGQVLMSLIMPALALGIYNGCKAVADGRKAGPDILLSGFRQNFPELVKIGGIYLIGTFAVLGLTALADDGDPRRADARPAQARRGHRRRPAAHRVAADRRARLDAADDGLLVRPPCSPAGAASRRRRRCSSASWPAGATGGPSWPTASACSRW